MKGVWVGLGEVEMGELGMREVGMGGREVCELEMGGVGLQWDDVGR